MAAVEFADLLPEGFSVERVEQCEGRVSFEVCEGYTWPDGRPYPELTVEVWLGDRVWGPQVSWPSTGGDSRPGLATALGVALLMAADEVAGA